MSHDPPEQERKRWLRREAISLGDLVVQIFAVVVGILLALFINDWVTQRQQQTTVNEAMRAMHAEVSRNRNALRAQTQHLFSMAQAMQEASANRDQSARLCMDWQGWSGVNAPNLTDAAYQTAIATQALANMPFKQAQIVAQVYGWQHLYQKFDDVDENLLIQHPQNLKFCVSAIEDIVQNNQQLDSAYAYLIGPDSHPRMKPKSSGSAAPANEPHPRSAHRS